MLNLLIYSFYKLEHLLYFVGAILFGKVFCAGEPVIPKDSKLIRLRFKGKKTRKYKFFVIIIIYTLSQKLVREVLIC